MSKFKSAEEMNTIRAENAKIVEKENAERKPEPNVAKPLAYFEVGRYVSGSFTGLFVVTQFITEDAKGHKLKVPIRKTVSDGDDIFMAMNLLEKAIRRRVFR